MNNRNAGIWWVLGIIIVLLLIVWGIWALMVPSAGNNTGISTTTTTTGTTDYSGTASQVVTSFGAALQNVSLLAPDASSTMASAYGPYVDPVLLLSWENNPQSAPGRATSSPWPDHIQVASVQQNGNTYVVSGNIVLMTSTGAAGNTPFTATVAQEGNNWYITNFSEASTTPAS